MPTICCPVRKADNIDLLLFCGWKKAEAGKNVISGCFALFYRLGKGRIKLLFPFCPLQSLPIDALPHTRRQNSVKKKYYKRCDDFFSIHCPVLYPSLTIVTSCIKLRNWELYVSLLHGKYTYFSKPRPPKNPKYWLILLRSHSQNRLRI